MNDDTPADTAPVTKGDISDRNIEKIFAKGFAADKGRETVGVLVPAERPRFGINAEEADACKIFSGDSPFTPPWLVGNVTSAWNVIEIAKHYVRFDPRTNSWAMLFAPAMIAQNIYVVESEGGKKRSVGYTSAFIGALMNETLRFDDPFEYTFDGEGQSRRCTVKARLLGHKRHLDYTSPPLAQCTPKRSPLWQSDPDQQLSYYARRAWARRHVPQVLLGINDVDELPGRIIDQPKDVTPVLMDTSAGVALHERLKQAQAEAADQPVEGFTEDAVQNGLGEQPVAEESPAKATTRRRQPRAKAAQPARKRKTPVATEAAPKREKRTSGAPKASPKPKAAPKAQETPKPRPLPTTPRQYAEHVRHWLAEIATEEGIEARWRSEMRLRNACGVVTEERAAIRLQLDQRIADLRQG
jgi:hypothetical protein